MAKVTFSNNGNLFFQSLKKSVDHYFVSNGIKRTGNFTLFLKTIILIPLAIAMPAMAGAVENVDSAPLVKSDLGDYIDDLITEELDGNLHIGDSITVDLSDIFEDSDLLIYSIITHNSSVAAVTLLSGDLRIDAKNNGSTMVEVIARMSDAGLPVHEQFRLNVAPISGIDVDGHGVPLGRFRALRRSAAKRNRMPEARPLPATANQTRRRFDGRTPSQLMT